MNQIHKEAYRLDERRRCERTSASIRVEIHHPAIGTNDVDGCHRIHGIAYARIEYRVVLNEPVVWEFPYVVDVGAIDFDGRVEVDKATVANNSAARAANDVKRMLTARI